MRVMLPSGERFVNHDSFLSRLPAAFFWAVCSAPMAVVLYATYLWRTQPAVSEAWVPGLLLVNVLTLLLIPWASSPYWIDIGADRLRVRMAGRTFSAPMSDVVQIEVGHHWKSPLVKNRAPAYWLKIQRASGRPWTFNYIRPGVGDRLLYALDQRHKPIFVWNGQ